MKRRNICFLAAVLVLIGIACEAQGSFLTRYFRFVNQSQYPIELKILTGFWCKNHQSGKIAPGTSWACDTNCAYAASMEAFISDSSRERIAFGSIMQLQSPLIGFCAGVCRNYVLSIYGGYNQISCACE